MRRAALLLSAVALLAAPTVLAFFSGGYFPGPRLWATVVVWLLVAVLTILGPLPVPRSTGGRVAAAALAFLVAWSALSITWAPLRGPAQESVTRLLLYLGALLLAVGVFRTRPLMRWAAPALAGGITIVILEGLSGRLLPGIVHLERSAKAGGRLEQPITYWNGEGALAAIGLVLCAHVAGDRDRPAWMRALAAACCAPLGAGVYLTISRGAIAAGVVGLLILLAAIPHYRQLRAVLLALGVAIAAAIVSSVPAVSSLDGSLASREADAAVVLAVLVLLMGGAATITVWLARLEDRDGDLRQGLLPHAARLPLLAGAVTALVVVGLVVGGLREHGGNTDLSTGASRLTSVSSNRYAYWKLGVQTFADHPLKGVGAGGFRVVWLRERPIAEGVNEVHSLELEMANELGLPGLLAFLLLLGGVAVAARRALAREPVLAAGALAASATWLLHASIDWDWQLPAVTLPAVVLVGLLLAAAEDEPTPATAAG